MAKRVLSIGIEPGLVDFSSMPGVNADMIRAGVAAQMNRLKELGYDADFLFTDLGDTAAAAVAEKLQARDVDCVLIGAGIRIPAYLLLFEQIINAVHAHAPRARICFNTSPADSVEAIQRWI